MPKLVTLEVVLVLGETDADLNAYVERRVIEDAATTYVHGELGGGTARSELKYTTAHYPVQSVYVTVKDVKA